MELKDVQQITEMVQKFGWFGIVGAIIFIFIKVAPTIKSLIAMFKETGAVPVKLSDADKKEIAKIAHSECRNFEPVSSTDIIGHIACLEGKEQ